MYDTATGNTISFTGLTTEYAMMPMFSTDGKELVYNDYPDADGAVSGRTLTMMGTSTCAREDDALEVLRIALYRTRTYYAGLALLHPGRQAESSSRSATTRTSPSEPSPPDYDAGSSQLYTIDIATKTSHRLDMTSGYNGSTDYLPFQGRDENLDFFPTVNPISAGGYYWVYFTSRRSYGNTEVMGKVPGKDDIASKSIWVTAVDINPTPGTDSRPPRFLPAGSRELGSGNIRVVAVLAPCVGDGATCERPDCCGGAVPSRAKVRPARDLRRRHGPMHGDRPLLRRHRGPVPRRGHSRSTRRFFAPRTSARGDSCSRSLATSAVQAESAFVRPRPSPVSPWKYS